MAETKKGSLADDDDFKHWTDEAGDPGVVTLYAGPAAGDYLADHADSMFGFPLGLVTGSSTECFGSSSDDGTTTEECTDEFPGDGFGEARQEQRRGLVDRRRPQGQVPRLRGHGRDPAVQRRRHRVRGGG